ncbi:TonB-dependent receptor [Mucilaginibacter sp.]|uniref:TonB-dependent receptor n=1 Tax=Mucilaginibacter sp. TaxID=1882438 RepID=UPI0025F2B85A|nr:TonB-dependent receptor [Mucilaginibacter sp.]
MMLKRYCFILLLFLCSGVYSQPAYTDKPEFVITVLNEKSQPAAGATVKLVQGDKPVKTIMSNIMGEASFSDIAAGAYTFLITYTGYKPQNTRVYHFPVNVSADTVILQPSSTALQEVSIVANTPFVQQKEGKTVLNVDASVTSIGSTVLEVLEKSPGVTVDRNGGIALQGKAGVLVMIDDKPTYLSGADLNNLLSSMSSAQVAQIELITNPTARYDASGNAGIINIKTKKNKQKGFNGSFTTSVGQGVYPKNSNSLVLNYRTGKINTFFNYNMNFVEYLLDLYALRKYYDANNILTAKLDQSSYLSGTSLNNTIKTGLDYYVSPKTTLGIVLSGTLVGRHGNNRAIANWLNTDNAVDSAIATTNKSHTHFKNGSINLNARHTISPSQDLGADIDWLHYNFLTQQSFNNTLLAPGGYQDIYRGNVPTIINIVSGKVDYTLRTDKSGTFQSGYKSSYSNTDNTALYENLDDLQWTEDYSKSNHFLYKENVNAVYSTFEKKYSKLTVQAGVRYEYTSYKAHQLGNAIQKDSAFSRNYGGFFPSGYISYQADSSNSFTLTAGRRIDRPVFQNLNPFYIIINKYTYQTGNPYLLPQYSWNFELSHQYKNLLTTSISYSNIKNYFSQLFLNDEAKGILLYTQGNVGSTYNLGLSSTLSVSPFNWWNVTMEALYNHKQLKGFNGNTYTSKIDQLNLNANNQFTIAKIYTAEISGFYTTKARNDVQELLSPTGQLSLGISRPLLKKKATLKFSARDIFYTNAMEGLTQFPNATEYFKLRRDTRVFTLAFTYRFGKSYKVAKRSDGSAADEKDRVGNS